jgi:TPR repeat protein
MADTKPATIAELEKLAKSGSSDALYELGLAYKKGEQVAQDTGKAIQYWKQAAHLKNAQSLVELGKLFYDGEGHGQDSDLAYNCFSDAATLGNVEAMFNLAELFMDGYRETTNEDESGKWLLKAAEGGHPEAPYFLAQGYRTGQWGLPLDEAKALKWSRKARIKAHLDTIVEKAMMYETDTSKHRREERAARWWQLAADCGDPHAQYMLGKAYWFGEGVDKNPSLAKAYMLDAAKQGDPEALNAYGFILMDDCDPDVQRQAIPYFEEAAKKGFVGALLNLGALYYNGNVVKSDDDKAYKYFEEAAEKGNDDERLIADTFIAFNQFDDNLPDDSEAEDRAFLKNEGEKEVLVKIPFLPDVSQLFAERHGLMTIGERETEVSGEYALGLGYEMGIQGFERNDEEAAYWYKKAATKHDAHAQAALGRFYMKGRGGLKKNVTKALHLYADAVRGGDESAMMHLADLFNAGKVLPHKMRYAYTLYDAALNSKESVPQAQDNIDEMLMDLSKKDRKKFFEKGIVPLEDVLVAVDKYADEITLKPSRKAAKKLAQ